MKRTPWMPLYCDDLVSSTADMSCDQLGAYVRLLCYLWTRGPLPLDESVICRIGSCKKTTWRAISNRFSPCSRDDGSPGLSQTRLESERMKRHVLREERAEAGRRGAASRWDGKANGKAIGKPMPCHNHNQKTSTRVSSTPRVREAAPAPQAAGLPRLAEIAEDDSSERNQAFIRQYRARRQS